MKFKKKFLLVLLCFSLNITPLYADLKVGTVFFKPPFVISVDNGFDIDLTRSLCQRMHYSCRFIPMDYHKLFTALDNGEIDIAIGGIYISRVRLEKYISSLPYMLSNAQLLVRQKSSFKTPKDLLGKTIGIIQGEQKSKGVFTTYLNLAYDTKIQVQEFNDMEDLISALSNGDIAAAFLHKSTANYWVLNGGGQFKLLGKDIPIGFGVGIIALPKNYPLIQKINLELQAMEKDNSYLKLYKMYFYNE